MGTPVDDEWIKKYDLIYKSIKYDNLSKNKQNRYLEKIQPNIMQKEALENLEELRKRGCKKALLISATGTGKTYLSAFDVASFNPKRCLFIVHRRNIAEAAMNTFKNCLLYTSPSPRDGLLSRMPSSA